MAQPVIIDTDPGIDDALAIMLAAASPEIDLLGIIAVAGNLSLEVTTRNAAALADRLRLPCPIGAGASGPIGRRATRFAEDVHGFSGLGTVTLPRSTRVVEPGIPLMARLVDESPARVTVLAIGPLTNVALLLTQYPNAHSGIERVVMMGGGTLEHTGNVTAAAEFNIYADPEAAARVMDSGIPITMVGLNVTQEALVSLDDLPRLVASGGQIAEMTRALLSSYREAEDRNSRVGRALHDSLAAAAIIDPAVLVTSRRHVDVETSGRFTTGMTVVDFRDLTDEGNCDVAVEVDAVRFRALMDERLAQLDASLRDTDS